MNYELSTWRRLAFTSALALTAACAGSSKDTDTDEPEDTVVIDTAPVEDPYMTPANLFILVQFAYDPDDDVARPVFSPTADYETPVIPIDTDVPDTDVDTDVDTDIDTDVDTDVPDVPDVPNSTEAPDNTELGGITVDFLFVTDDWDGSFGDDDNFCFVEYAFGSETLPRAAWADGEGDDELGTNVMFGFDVPASATVTGENCSVMLDPVDWPDMAGAIDALQWSFGMSRNMSSETEAAYGFDPEDLETITSAGLAGDFGFSFTPMGEGYYDSALGFANQVDHQFVLEVEANAAVPLEVVDMVDADGNMAAGAYSLQLFLPMDPIEDWLTGP
jgi:hypothetical protein